MISETLATGFDPTSPQAQSLVTAMSYVSLALIFVAFGLIAALSMRSRTISSFQFELYIFILVVVLAEVPKIASDLGFINDMQLYALPGLELHSISMAFLSGFVLWRAFKAVGGRKMNKKTKMAQPNNSISPV
jgi:hypothetical protein